MNHVLKNLLLLSSLIFCSAIASNAFANNRGEIRFTGVYGELLTNIEKHVRLVKRLRDKTSSPLLDGERRRLELRAPMEIKQALEPFGYYLPTVESDLEHAPEKYRYVVTLNEPVKIANIELLLDDDAVKQDEFTKWQEQFPLKVGMPLDQAQYDSYKKALISNAIRLGYFDAKYTKSAIVINESRTQANITLRFTSGKRYSISDVSVIWNTEGLDDNKNKRGVDRDILKSLFSIKAGQLYTADNLVKTQQNCLATPYFSSVDVRSGERDSHKHTIPITVKLTPSKRKAYNFAIGAGTDTGVRASVGYENRRINRQGHHINARIGGSAIQKTAIANYRIPLARSSKDSLNFYASLEEETGDSRRFQAVKVGTEWARSWDESLLKFGLIASREKFERSEDDLSQVEREIDLLMPTFAWERTKRNDLYFPTKGWSANILLRATSESLGSDIDLAQAIFNGKILRPLGPGRLKLRFTVAGSLIDEAIALPESLGFLAGGDDSIRGYSYESIGVERNGEISVGKNLVVASMEYQHPIKSGFALAGFIDAGDAFDSNPVYQRGAGLGIRWRLPFGALRLDLASALDREGQPLRLHFSFGTDL
jgi:translocation and assembly module TamA